MAKVTTADVLKMTDEEVRAVDLADCDDDAADVVSMIVAMTSPHPDEDEYPLDPPNEARVAQHRALEAERAPHDAAVEARVVAMFDAHERAVLAAFDKATGS